MNRKESENPRFLAYGLILVGVVFIGVGIALGSIATKRYPGTQLGYVDYPYQNAGAALLFFGIFLIIVGGIAYKHIGRTQPRPAPSRYPKPRGRFYSQCGKPLSIEANFCPNCGRELG